MDEETFPLCHSLNLPLLYIHENYIQYSHKYVRNIFLLFPSIVLNHPFHPFNGFKKIPLHYIIGTSLIDTKLPGGYFVFSHGDPCVVLLTDSNILSWCSIKYTRQSYYALYPLNPHQIFRVIDISIIVGLVLGIRTHKKQEGGDIFKIIPHLLLLIFSLAMASYRSGSFLGDLIY